MGKVVVEMSMSLDGFVAGPKDDLSQVHDWRFPASGSPDPANAKNVEEMFASAGAVIMGWNTWYLGDKLNDWVKNPPFECPTFVLVHKLPERAKEAGSKLIFVTEGIERALEPAKAAAGDRNVVVNGGAQVVQQALKAGLVDEFHLHLVPFVLGAGVSLFDGIGQQIALRQESVVAAPGVAHLVYAIDK